VPEKKCFKCGVVKDVGEFNRNKSKKDGYSTECKLCIRQYKRKYYKKHRDKVLNYQKNYRDNNIERIKLYQKRYQTDNADRLKEYKKEYHIKNRDKIITRATLWWKANRKKKYAHVKKWQLKNKEKVHKISQAWACRNPDKVKAKARRKSKRDWCNLKENVLRRRLEHENGITPTPKQIQERRELILFHREIVKLNRRLQDVTDNEGNRGVESAE